ncbi:MAG: SAM-dependent methyltransferase, partial [Cellulomonadaceae bacterium]
GGIALFGFHAGTGAREVHRAYGHDVKLTVHRHDPDGVQAALGGAELEVRARLMRTARESERDDQAIVLMRRTA